MCTGLRSARKDPFEPLPICKHARRYAAFAGKTIAHRARHARCVRIQASGLTANAPRSRRVHKCRRPWAKRRGDCAICLGWDVLANLRPIPAPGRRGARPEKPVVRHPTGPVEQSSNSDKGLLGHQDPVHHGRRNRANCLAVKAGFGKGAASAVMAALLLIAVLAQLRSRTCTPWIYGVTVVLVSVAGTPITDALTDGFSVRLHLRTATAAALALELPERPGF